MRRPEVDLARKLRRKMSLPEVLLWQRLRVARNSARFRRQHPIGPYIIDFYSARARLAVEIDGAVHDARQEDNARRDAFLRDSGYRVLRLAAAEVLRDPDMAASSIVALAESPLHPSAAPSGPPPRAGEDC